jgi:hypothetical protein
MKKQYIEAPDFELIEGSLCEMICSSITKVEGDTGITTADPNEEIPGTANSRQHNIWNDEYE